jgi:hypothetical protein
MTEALTDRCTRLAAPVVALMQHAIQSQGDATVLPRIDVL